jgi:hypothetical protein
MPKPDSEAIVSERHSSLDKNKEENRQREIFAEGPRDAREGDL